jgi:hypothetical protein
MFPAVPQETDAPPPAKNVVIEASPREDTIVQAEPLGQAIGGRVQHFQEESGPYAMHAAGISQRLAEVEGGNRMP